MSNSFLYNEKGRISAVLKNIGDGVISTDINGIIDFMNNSAEQLTGWMSVKALGKPLDAIFRLVNSVSRECVKSPFISAVEAGTQVGLPNYTALITKDGIERLVSANTSPIQDEHGKTDGVVVIFRDITRFMQYEEELRVERNNLRVNFEHAPIGMAIVSEDCKILDANNSFLDTFGIEYGGVAGKRFGEGIDCKNSLESGCGNGNECKNCQLRQSITEVLKNASPIKNLENESTLVRDSKDLYKYFKVNFVPIIDSGMTNVMVSIEDITEQKYADIALKKYQILAEKARDTILFVNMDGLIIEANESALKSYGYAREEILTKTIFHLRGGDPEVRKQMDLVKQKGLFFEAIHFRKDGSSFPVEVSTQSTIIGGREVFLSIIRDISERKRIETALKESEEKYRSLFNSSLDAIYFHELVETENGVSSRFMEVNDAACSKLGYSREELLEMSPSRINSDNMKSKLGDMYKKLMDEGYGTFETIHMSKEGAEIPVELSAHYFDMNGRKYFLTSARDITERKQVEAEMKKAMETAHAAYKAKSEFLANMSHEIRTPLNGVIGMIDLTMLTELTAEQKDNLLTAKTCADSLLKIINDILDFSKIEAGKLIIEKIDFDLKSLIEKIIKVHNYRAIEKGLEFNCQLPVDLPSSLKGDPARLQQVLNNLIGNAIKFTDKGAVNVTIKSLGCTNGILKLQLMVADTGIGIASKEKEKLFKSFSQVDSSHSRKFGGTGLGLVISKQLVEMMGGSIWVESEKGKGSVFYLELGFEVSSNNRGVRDSINLDTIAKTQSKASILLVEDDNINQIVVSRMLKEMGFSYSIANNGIEAISILTEKSFDICLMDIQMPGMDGIQTTAAIRNSEKNTSRHLPIIALTAHALLGDKEKFISLGMDDYLAKPFQMNDLYNIIEGLLERYRSESSEDILKKLISDDVKESGITETKLNDFSEDIKSGIFEISETISKLMKLSRIEDVATVEKMAHEIKAMASVINADKVKTLAFRVELSARRGDFAGAYSLFNELCDAFQDFSNKFNVLKNQ